METRRPGRVAVTVRLTGETLARIERVTPIAERNHSAFQLSRADVIRIALDEGLRVLEARLPRHRR